MSDQIHLDEVELDRRLRACLNGRMFNEQRAHEVIIPLWQAGHRDLLVCAEKTLWAMTRETMRTEILKMTILVNWLINRED